MASEIRVNQIQSRTGLSTVTFSDTGIVVENRISVGSAFLSSNVVGLGTTTTAGRNAGVGTAVGSIIYNETVGEVQIYKRNSGWVSIGSSSGDPVPPILGQTALTATGGIINDYSTPPGALYRSHIFTSSGTFNVSALSPTAPYNFIDILTVGGGGAGGNGRTGGGGGAGGFIQTPALPISVGPYTVVVGSGAARGTNGSPTSISSPGSPLSTSQGGGRGGTDPDGYNSVSGAGYPGGSGGGARSNSPTATGGDGNRSVGTNTAVPTQGNPGGSTGPLGGGGGGGAGGAGGQGEPTGSADGGVGSPNVYAFGPANPVMYAGGGGGGQSESLSGGNPGGSGGGGTGQGGPGTPAATDGSFATGGGGGGTGPGQSLSGNGGSGIVVVRYQIGSLTASAKATGGAISFYNSKTIHTFTSSGTFTITNPSLTSVEYVVIAGGGGGGNAQGGGGGAGGYTNSLSFPTPATPGIYTVTIGSGGSGGAGTNGSNSVFGSVTATGGGAGGGRGGPIYAGNPGGSGGGGSPNGTNQPGGTGSPQGNSGGTGVESAPQYGGGGGGGAGGAGGNGTSTTGGAGGVGVQLPATFQNPQSATSLGTPGPGGSYYVAGGGAGYGVNNPSTPGGYGGGGPGNTPVATPGTQNTGGGGGGGGTGASGGSGIVLIAYPS